MKDFSPNHYERAFENWLKDHRIEYVAEYQHERATIKGVDIKSFDFLLYPHSRPIIVEVKGRTFKGTSLIQSLTLTCR